MTHTEDLSKLSQAVTNRLQSESNPLVSEHKKRVLDALVNQATTKAANASTTPEIERAIGVGHAGGRMSKN